MWTDPIDGQDVYRCPNTLAYEDAGTVRKIFRYYRGYLDGFLPFDGAISDQPANLVECFAEISSVKSILDADDMDQNRNGNDDSSDSEGFKRVRPKD